MLFRNFSRGTCLRIFLYMLLFMGSIIGAVLVFLFFWLKDPDLLAEFPTSNAAEIKVVVPETFRFYGCSSSFTAKTYQTFATDSEMFELFQYYSQVGIQRGLQEKLLKTANKDRPNNFACFEGKSRNRGVPTVVVAVVNKDDDFAFTTLKTLSGVVNKKTFFLLLYGYTNYV